MLVFGCHRFNKVVIFLMICVLFIHAEVIFALWDAFFILMISSLCHLFLIEHILYDTIRNMRKIIVLFIVRWSFYILLCAYQLYRYFSWSEEQTWQEKGGKCEYCFIQAVIRFFSLCCFWSLLESVLLWQVNTTISVFLTGEHF